MSVVLSAILHLMMLFIFLDMINLTTSGVYIAGNARFRECIIQHLPNYLHCTNSNERLNLVERIVRIIESYNNGRFLRKNHVTNRVCTAVLLSYFASVLVVLLYQ